MKKSRPHREQRVVTRCKVAFERLDRTVVAESEDLSRRGVFVRTEELLPAGAVVELDITLPNLIRVGIIARVAHLLAPSAARALGRRAGMGFEFLERDTEGRERLAEYLDDLIEEVTPPPQQMPGRQSVLVADPSEPLLDRLSMALGSAGYDVITFANGAEAFSSALESPPDVLICAAEMPLMDGWTLVKMMAARPSLCDVPVVLMDDDANDITRLQAYRLGVRDFVHKPFTDEEMILRLRRIPVDEQAASERVALRGTLGPIAIGTLLSLLEFERKSGILVVLREAQAARLFVALGRVVKVEASGIEPGDDPVVRLMSVLDWGDGNFEFTACEVVGGDEICLGTTQLLMEHARIRDEAKPR